MKPIVPIVFAADNQFAPYCSVSIASLIANRDPQRQYALFILYHDMNAKNASLLESMATENVTIKCLNITRFVEEGLFYTHGRMTITTYFRFFVGDVLPDYDKILYLDSDIIILRDIAELFDTDIGDRLLGGVCTYRSDDSATLAMSDYLKKQMNTTPYEYINAGILLINLKAFRAEGIRPKCIAYLRRHRDLKWMDQDVLNAVCRGRIQYLSENWNMSQFYYEQDYRAGKDMSQVRIVHYLNRIKPWLEPMRLSHIFFYQYSALTPYMRQLTSAYLAANYDDYNKDVMTYREEGEGAMRAKLLKLTRAGYLGPRMYAKAGLLWLRRFFSRKSRAAKHAA
jgi:lipopolysaccharide biosynthesis glycosyltransferase